MGGGHFVKHELRDGRVFCGKRVASSRKCRREFHSRSAVGAIPGESLGLRLNLCCGSEIVCLLAMAPARFFATKAKLFVYFPARRLWTRRPGHFSCHFLPMAKPFGAPRMIVANHPYRFAPVLVFGFLDFWVFGFLGLSFLSVACRGFGCGKCGFAGEMSTSGTAVPRCRATLLCSCRAGARRSRACVQLSPADDLPDTLRRHAQI